MTRCVLIQVSGHIFYKLPKEDSGNSSLHSQLCLGLSVISLQLASHYRLWFNKVGVRKFYYTLYLKSQFHRS